MFVGYRTRPFSRVGTRWKNETTLVRELWLQEQLDDDWTLACRLVAQDGRPVIAEVRIFPYEDLPDGQSWELGEWRGSQGLGGSDEEENDADDLVEAHPLVPSGGLGSRVLRDARLGSLLTQVQEEILQMERAHGRERLYSDKSEFRRHGFVPTGGDDRQRQGRPRLHTTIWYARLADQYVRLCDARNPAPVVTLAGRYHVGVDSMRRYIYDCRDREGMLTQSRPGIAGGQLTTKAKMLLQMNPQKRQK